ncbi:hypothetical protein OG889_44655 [Streptomyces sp. NBC_00481]|uniref:hypothetical protein n=1 Tax=unclassified Streptomyces TaxID=2593676 RepID=UPI002DD87469|nr:MULTISPECIES: hypothetical protein [unclassified Streptomyces]WRZ01152.1 hypothetical protein OG889_44655 [Streptomyces sp. NBC_00481]
MSRPATITTSAAARRDHARLVHVIRYMTGAVPVNTDLAPAKKAVVLRVAVDRFLRRLVNAFLIAPALGLIHLHWSGWRRQHHLRAKRSHYTRRLSLELQP